MMTLLCSFDSFLSGLRSVSFLPLEQEQSDDGTCPPSQLSLILRRVDGARATRWTDMPDVILVVIGNLRVCRRGKAVIDGCLLEWPMIGSAFCSPSVVSKQPGMGLSAIFHCLLAPVLPLSFQCLTSIFIGPMPILLQIPP